MDNLIQQIQDRYSFLDNIVTNFWKTWIKSNKFIKLELKNVRWKNKKAEPGTAYVPTEIEHAANVLTHGLWVLPAMYAALLLFDRSLSNSQIMVALVYGTALSLLFFISTCFHCVHYCNCHGAVKNALHRCDRAMIYVFIASSYFPWLQLENPRHSWVLASMEWGIWILAIFGIAYQQMYHERFKCLETIMYIIMGLGPALVVIATGHEFNGMPELKYGGFLYILGILFFKADGIIPMAHAIWHLFVVYAAATHYFAILKHLFPPLNDTIEKRN